jgi:hypothetical protein
MSVCQNPYCDKKAEYFAKWKLCHKCQHEAVDDFVLSQIFKKTMENLMGGTE